ncbi:hypothetical protein HaLaN_08782 [Haematococcus lacustris]|uniref:Uncharacterized protein n=1 Tax=Haematococcus lacustris TaxID=44745 RepID=A0A699YRY9_HAELA|nr:hypothetical protein HaLaN_08782 [Haematococcus lacustris]
MARRYSAARCSRCLTLGSRGQSLQVSPAAQLQGALLALPNALEVEARVGVPVQPPAPWGGLGSWHWASCSKGGLVAPGQGGPGQGGLGVRRPQHGVGNLHAITPHLLASGALILASESMPAQASADTPQLLTIDCSSGEEWHQ